MFAPGIKAHPLYRLGKKPAIVDSRTLKFAKLLRADATPPPTEFDWDVAHGGHVPMPMFANDRHGCCVISGRAAQTLRFELAEQGKLLGITDEEVLAEYFKETGGADSGLVVLKSLAAWRKTGWKIGEDDYKIKAFASINVQAREEVKAAIYADLGVGIGVSLPLSAQGQVGQVWDVTGDPFSNAPGSWGGHYVFCPAYNATGPICVTWGARQQMTWRFWETYCDECYAIFDAKNDTKPPDPGHPSWNSILWDVLEEFLKWLQTK